MRKKNSQSPAEYQEDSIGRVVPTKKKRFRPEEKAAAVQLFRDGIPAQDIAEQLECHVSQIYRWLVQGMAASELDSLYETKRRQLKAFYTLAAGQLAEESMVLGSAGDGKGAQGLAVASGVFLDKAELLAGRAPTARFGANQPRQVIEQPTQAPTETPENVMQRLQELRHGTEEAPGGTNEPGK